MTIRIEESSEKNGSTGAFPCQYWITLNNGEATPLEHELGMTKREYFASQIMANLSHLTFDQGLAAEAAVSAADELLAALERVRPSV